MEIKITTRLNEIKRYICSIIINQCVKKNNGPGLSVTSIKKETLNSTHLMMSGAFLLLNILSEKRKMEGKFIM